MAASIRINMAIVVLVACTLSGCVGSGRRTSEPRQIADFSEIEISGPMWLFVDVGPDISCTVEGDDNLLERIETDVRGGKLHVRARRPVVPDNPLEVYLTTPRLSYIGVSLAGDVDLALKGNPLDTLKIKMTGAGKLNLRGVHANRLEVDVTGAGKVDASGEVGHLDFGLSGMGAGVFRELCADTVTVRQKGAGRTYVSVRDKLGVEKLGAGSVYYYGDPELDFNESGPGGVARVEENACAP